MAGDGAARHVEADVAAAGAALLGGQQRQIDRVGHEIGARQEAVLLGLRREIIRLAGKPVLEIVRTVEDEIEIVVAVDHRRRVGHRDEAHRSWPEPLKCWYQPLSGMAKMAPAAIRR